MPLKADRSRCPPRLLRWKDSFRRRGVARGLDEARRALGVIFQADARALTRTATRASLSCTRTCTCTCTNRGGWS
jgi:hypothetical protein